MLKNKVMAVQAMAAPPTANAGAFNAAGRFIGTSHGILLDPDGNQFQQ
jgi:hypothetical protein